MKTKTKRTARPMTAADRRKQLGQYVALCFTMLRDTTTDPKEISNLSGLSLATIYRLRNGEFTLAIRDGPSARYRRRAQAGNERV